MGGGGDDSLAGGEGEDTAVFSGPSSEYEIARDGQTIIVRDQVSERDGTDSLLSVEHLQFSDERMSIALGL